MVILSIVIVIKQKKKLCFFCKLLMGTFEICWETVHRGITKTDLGSLLWGKGRASLCSVSFISSCSYGMW